MNSAFGQIYAAELRMVLAVLVSAAVCFCPREPARAEGNDKQLLVTHVSSSLTDVPDTAVTPLRATRNSQTVALSESASSQITALQRGMTRDEKWEQFETEFGVHQKSSSFMKGTLESAKYRLDKTVFAVQEWTDNVEDALKFDYSLPNPAGSLTSTDPARIDNPIPFWGSMDNPHLKSDINLDPFSKRAFVGLRLVIKFGN